MVRIAALHSTQTPNSIHHDRLTHSVSDYGHRVQLPTRLATNHLDVMIDSLPPRYPTNPIAESTLANNLQLLYLPLSASKLL